MDTPGGDPNQWASLSQKGEAGAFAELVSAPLQACMCDRESRGQAVVAAAAGARPLAGLLYDPHQLPWEEEKQIFSLMAQIVFDTYQQEFLTTLFSQILGI